MLACTGESLPQAARTWRGNLAPTDAARTWGDALREGNPKQKTHCAKLHNLCHTHRAPRNTAKAAPVPAKGSGKGVTQIETESQRLTPQVQDLNTGGACSHGERQDQCSRR